MSGFKQRLASWILAAFGFGLLLAHTGAGSAFAQGMVPSLLDPRSPLVCIPPLQGEVRFTLTWAQVLSGKQTIPALGLSWDLRNDFLIRQPQLFLDTMVRLQAGRIGVRANYELRNFAGERNLADGVIARNEFDFTGIRIGGDFDIYQRWNTRFGVNLDYTIYHPIFTEASFTLGGKKIEGDPPVTLGLYGSYNPPRCIFGATFICDGEIRWAFTGANLTDWRISAGLKSPDTVLGSWALKGGYRQTSIGFQD